MSILSKIAVRNIVGKTKAQTYRNLQRGDSLLPKFVQVRAKYFEKELDSIFYHSTHALSANIMPDRCGITL